MIAVLQRVERSSVKVDGELVGSIETGLTILLGIVKGDDESHLDRLLSRIPYLRIFQDEKGKMNRSLEEIGGAALVVSQFTLASDLSRGRRPSFDGAMPPKEAERLYDLFCHELAKIVPVETGRFGAMMEVEILNDGPVTFILDSREI